MRGSLRRAEYAAACVAAAALYCRGRQNTKVFYSPILCSHLQVGASGVLVPHGAEAAGAWQRSAQQLAQDYLVKQVGPVAAVVLHAVVLLGAAT